MDPKKIARIEHYFQLQIPAGKAFLEYNKLYPGESVGKSTFFKYYQKLRKGEPMYKSNFSPGRPRSIDEERLHQMVLCNPFMTTRELAKELGCTFSAVAKRLRAMCFVNKWSVWVPHDLPPRPQNDALKWRKPS